MKKLFLLATMFAATVCNAQTVLWDGEDKEVGSDGGFWNRAEPTVVEEDGNKCLKIIILILLLEIIHRLIEFFWKLFHKSLKLIK